jgi:hypothetical protein
VDATDWRWFSVANIGIICDKPEIDDATDWRWFSVANIGIICDKP